MTKQFQTGLMVFGAAVSALWLLGASHSIGQESRVSKAAPTATAHVLPSLVIWLSLEPSLENMLTPAEGRETTGKK